MSTNAVTRVKGEVVQRGATSPATQPTYQARILHQHEHNVTVKSADEPKNVKTVVDEKQPRDTNVNVKGQPIKQVRRSVKFGPIIAQITTAAIIGAIVLHADNASGILKWFSRIFADVSHLAD